MKKLIKLMFKNYPLRDKEGAARADGGADKNADLAAQLAALKAQFDDLKAGKGKDSEPEPKDPSVIEKAQQEALLRFERADDKGDDNVLSMRRFIVPVIINEKPAYAKLTLKESNSEGHFEKRIYTIELHSLEQVEQGNAGLDSLA